MEMSRTYREEIKQKAELLRAIAHPVRLCLVRKLYEHGRCNVTYFMDCMDTSQSNISQHLAKMRSLGVLDCEKEGQNVYYFIKNEQIKRILSVMFDEEGEER
ncbi:ArsR/SmtB family transcription factor [Lachnoclostridium sp. Marseille-P6806]|uniref:ArsR/SmtB family transcription factor n=1 Tax=Lachnoclostridium sp. Marseille-P6806 TaxID=2364793 RepID=UPI001031F00D|nr:metalloregulator ArsR/SmtB family transcription factor [Lachnoclostridium sp. Marseille-P6806]